MTTYAHDKKSWINVAKTFSIGGVVLQHVRGYAYSNDYIFYSVWWTVALFIVIGGYNAFSSYERRGKFLIKKKLLGIIIPYFFATVIYVIYNDRYFDVSTVLQRLLRFNASAPLYYVAVYIQLLFISPILIGIINVCDRKKYFFIISWALLLVCGYLSTRYTNVFDIIIGGGYLFAGPWLLFWYLGMCIKNMEKHVSLKPGVKYVFFVVLSIFIAVWQYFFVNRGLNLKLGSMYHGEQVGMTWANALETVLILFWFKYSVEIVEKNMVKASKILVRLFDYLGGFTLYIFLYHMLFLSIYTGYLEVSIAEINRWLCLVFIIAGPVVLGMILQKGKSIIIDIMKNVVVE